MKKHKMSCSWKWACFNRSFPGELEGNIIAHHWGKKAFPPKCKRLHHEMQGCILEGIRIIAESFELFLIAWSALGIRSRKMFETSSFAAVRMHKVERELTRSQAAQVQCEWIQGAQLFMGSFFAGLPGTLGCYCRPREREELHSISAFLRASSTWPWIFNEETSPFITAHSLEEQMHYTKNHTAGPSIRGPSILYRAQELLTVVCIQLWL